MKTYLIPPVKMYIPLVLSFYIDVYISFLLFHYQQVTTTYVSFYSTYIPDKIIEFNEFNKMFKKGKLESLPIE